MSSVQEIEEAIRRLQPSGLQAFQARFAEYDAEFWDCEIETHVAAGRLHRLGEEALRDLREGRCSNL